MNEIRFIDLFAGVGGFHKGLQQASLEPKQLSGKELQVGRSRNCSKPTKRKQPNFSCVWANEWDKHAAQTYKARFPNTPFHEGDIRTVDANGLPEFDLLCGGFPCQSFSLAGKRKGFDDTRGTLFFEIARIIKAKRPPLVLLENVKGLLSHENGATFGRIIQVLGELGYWVEWQVLNSKNFGVPQNRERVFIAGHLGTKGGKQIFPIRQGNESNSSAQGRPQSNGTRIRCANSLDANYYKGGGRQYIQEGGGLNDEKVLCGNKKNNTIFSNGQKNENNCGTIQREMGSEGRMQTHERDNRMIALSSSGRSWGRESRATPGQANALETGKGCDGQSSQTRVIGNKIRRLTPTECERLQGFPDNWTKGLSDTQRYKCMGNAVTVNVIEALGEKIIARFKRS